MDGFSRLVGDFVFNYIYFTRVTCFQGLFATAPVICDSLGNHVPLEVAQATVPWWSFFRSPSLEWELFEDGLSLVILEPCCQHSA